MRASCKSALQTAEAIRADETQSYKKDGKISVHPVLAQMLVVAAQELATLTANQERLEELLAVQDCHRFLVACSGRR